MVLDIVTEFIEVSNISKAFGLDVNSFLVLILGSFIMGYAGLTFFYKIYYNQVHQEWDDLEFSEKAIVSLFLGFLTILASLYAVGTWQLMYINNKNFEQLFSQLNYVFPFLYFVIISTFLARKYKGLDFIKEYIWVSLNAIIILVLLFVLSIFYLIRNWYGIFLIIVLVVLYIIGFKLIKKYNPFKDLFKY
ncbi:MAG: hypothetical protein V1709_03485 [Planctomycetota bacterium]